MHVHIHIHTYLHAHTHTHTGVVTLASLIPVDTVLLLTILLPERQRGRRPIIAADASGSEGGVDAAPDGTMLAWYDETPTTEIVSGVRALVPLVLLM